ncbi:YdcF family protein [Sporomusa sp.]|uniref:YdcF family protein n=1 Tax=Sporomusa sp. TaxID=2078658 RepID=UPI002C0D6BB2|nr:YdcF family protein [Sporomusa sp.]HWR45460.1 YdcF family protein [Sporomusa sp.]
MLVLIKFLYITFLLPPGLFIAALTLLCLWLYRRKQQGVRVLAVITGLLYLISTPLVGDWLMRSLETRYQPPQSVSGDVIVMLGGGATADTPNVHGKGHLTGFAANRLLTAAQLHYITGAPIIISGGQVFANSGKEAEIAEHILRGLGIPANKIIVEGQSLNTADNAKFTKKILDEQGFSSPVLVTSAFHMERSVKQFTKYNMAVTPYPTDYQTNTQFIFEWHQLWPRADAFYNTQLAIKEYLGLLAVNWF